MQGIALEIRLTFSIEDQYHIVLVRLQQESSIVSL